MEVVISATIWIRNRSWNTINISNMIVFVVTLVNLLDKLVSSHITSSVIIMEAFISS